MVSFLLEPGAYREEVVGMSVLSDTRWGWDDGQFEGCCFIEQYLLSGNLGVEALCERRAMVETEETEDSEQEEAHEGDPGESQEEEEGEKLELVVVVVVVGVGVVVVVAELLVFEFWVVVAKSSKEHFDLQDDEEEDVEP